LNAQMPPASKKSEGALTAAAAAFDAALTRFEAASEELERMEIVSEKSLQRARRALEGCAEQEQELSAHLQAFAAAMQTSQARQQKCMEATVAAANRIKARFDERNALLERVAALGLRAREINDPVVAAMEQDAKEGGAPTAALLTSLEEFGANTDAIIAEADSLMRAAKDSDWEDIERDAHTLKQQLMSALNKVRVIQRNIATRAPS
jgi:hypothetical protein